MEDSDAWPVSREACLRDARVNKRGLIGGCAASQWTIVVPRYQHSVPQGR